MELLTLAKAAFSRSNADPKHPFRYFTLCTLGPYPEARMVVKRKSSADLSILFYTDSRSPKAAQIKADGRVSGLFYHPKEKLQVRLKGQAQAVGSDHPQFGAMIAQTGQSPPTKDYGTLLAPGQPLEDPTRAIFGADTYFLAMAIVPHELDVLQLGTTSHLRSRFTLSGGQWAATRLVP